MRITCLFNPISGRGRGSSEATRLAAALVAAGHEARRLETRPADTADPEWLVRELVGVDLLVVLGGDGAVRLAAPAAGAAGVPLYQAPAGTENLFAKSFGMRTDARTLLAAIEAWTIRRIDTGLVRIGGSVEPFTIMGSIGFDASVVEDLAASRSGPITHWSYARPILRQLRSWKPPRLRVEVDDETLAEGPAFVMVANLPDYARGLNPARWADPADGLLDAVVFPTPNTRSLLRWAAQIATGWHLEDARLRYRVGRRIVVSSNEPVALQLDGDAAGGGSGTRVEFEVAPATLSVLVPPRRGETAPLPILQVRRAASRILPIGPGPDPTTASARRREGDGRRPTPCRSGPFVRRRSNGRGSAPDASSAADSNW